MIRVNVLLLITTLSLGSPSLPDALNMFEPLNCFCRQSLAQLLPWISALADRKKKHHETNSLFQFSLVTWFLPAMLTAERQRGACQPSVDPAQHACSTRLGQDVPRSCLVVVDDDEPPAKFGKPQTEVGCEVETRAQRTVPPPNPPPSSLSVHSPYTRTGALSSVSAHLRPLKLKPPRENYSLGTVAPPRCRLPVASSSGHHQFTMRVPQRRRHLRRAAGIRRTSF
jgi:hypothetical protein